MSGSATRHRLPASISLSSVWGAGFIRDLPTQLIKAFQATLDETLQADLLLHVIDQSNPDASEQKRAVLHVLKQLGIPEASHAERIVEVHNKADLLPAQLPAATAPAAADTTESTVSSELQVAGQRQTQQDVSERKSGSLQRVQPAEPVAVLVSAQTGQGISELLDVIDDRLKVPVQAMELSC